MCVCLFACNRSIIHMSTKSIPVDAAATALPYTPGERKEMKKEKKKTRTKKKEARIC